MPTYRPTSAAELLMPAESCRNFIILIGVTVGKITRQLSYRKEDRAMRPIIY